MCSKLLALVLLMFACGTGYAAKKFLPVVQKDTFERIANSLSFTGSLPENWTGK